MSRPPVKLRNIECRLDRGSIEPQRHPCIQSGSSSSSSSSSSRKGTSSAARLSFLSGDVLIPKRASLQLPGLLLLLASRHARAAGAPHPFEARESTGMARRLGGWRGATAREWKKDGGLIHANRRVRAGRVRGSSDLRVASSPPPTAYSPSSLAFFGPL
jgi:hypothetical protein